MARFVAVRGQNLDKVHARQTVREMKHLGGSSAVETRDPFDSTHTIKQLLLFLCPNVPAAPSVLQQCLCYLRQLSGSWNAPWGSV